MTEAEAIRVLRPPLKFGDESQIRARRFLERLQHSCEIIEAQSICPECEGDGDSKEKCPWCAGDGNDDGEDCLECRGTGWFRDRCPRCHGTGHAWCVADFGDRWPGSDVMAAAIDRLSNRLAAFRTRL